ncbi:MAG: hypothetical protein NTU47_13105 [Ignavibacteriales bacterium]|nr:hypothetical protein [Ignavibacteriales bacterium]
MSTDIKYEDPQFQSFNESLDEEGDVNIANISFQRSRILFELGKESYKDAYSEYLEQELEDLKQSVFDSYPACIAYNFRLSEKGEGGTDPVRKLLHLKDSWEAIVYVLYSLVMGEVRHRQVDLKESQIFVSLGPSGSPAYTSFNTDRVLSEAVKQKLHNIKAIVQHSKGNSLGFKCECIDESLLDELLQLQDIRNDISHHAAPTREQADFELNQVIPLFESMLAKTRFLENCKILRFESYSSTCRCESFNGHALNREYDSYPFVDAQKTLVLNLGHEQLFVRWDTECFSLSPFLHYDKDASGHESYICFYKRKKESKYWYEPVKIRTEKSIDHLQGRFDAEKDEIIRLLVP